jgi:multiple sugar transport system substrate-binding protein
MATIMALTGCGQPSSSPSAGKTIVRYARWGLPEEIQAERQLLKVFEENNPDIQVKIEYCSWGEYWNKLQAQMAAGSAPDVFLLNGGYANDYASRGQLENLQPWLEKDGSVSLDEFFPQTIEIFRFDNGLWGMPRDCNTVAMYVNKTLFEKYGVELPKPDWTWQEFLEKARKLTKDENGDGRTDIFGFNAGYDSMEVHWGYWVWQNGGKILNTERTKCLLNEPAAIEALEFYAGLVTKEKVAPDTAQSSTFGSNIFLTNRVAMSAEGSWMIKSFSEAQHFKWAIFPLPQGKQKAAPVNGLANAMYAQSKNKDAAWRLMKFFASRPYQELLARSGTSIPAMRAVAESNVYLDGKVEGKEYLLEQLTYARPLDFTRGFGKWEDAIRGELELVWLGKQDVPTAARNAAKKVDEILAQEQGYGKNK